MPIDLNAVKDLTVTICLAVAIVSFYRGWVIPGVVYERDIAEVRKERDYEREEKVKWQEIAFQAIRSTESIATTAEAAAAALKSDQAQAQSSRNRKIP